MFTVYAISSQVRTYVYVGLTSDLADRIHRHNSGYERTTRAYRPFQLVYQKEFLKRAEAREHEKYLKTTQGRRILWEKSRTGLPVADRFDSRSLYGSLTAM